MQCGFSLMGKGMAHILGGTEQDVARFHNTTQNDVQFKIYELFLKFFIKNLGSWLTRAN
jgi:hypothetical protein